jgi:hydrogenase nickel incorporation protein HypB
VCPALFDLGERARVVMLSVTEGDDKPLKYPHMFRAAEVVVISKSDLLPHVDFSIGRCRQCAGGKPADQELCPFRYHPGKVSVPGTIG